MSEKDIKTKPQATTKSVKNAPKAADRFAKEAVKDIKTVSKDVLVKNTILHFPHPKQYEFFYLQKAEFYRLYYPYFLLRTDLYT